MKNTMRKILRKTRNVLVFAVFSAPLWLTAPLPLHAAELEGYAWGDKLTRGALNIVSSPVETARTVYLESENEGYGYGWTVGLAKGLGRTVVRLGAGVVDLLTFPFDFPDEHKAPLILPEYAWQHGSGETAI